ncbi:hypothetical protein ACFWN1_14735 [Streptomyces sp. NPDC058459]|uniref:zinc finger domain-containing protein n=1 Tax=Streptomyces sp. NPDC058459 TaxID=3346508 RepID=UPI00365B775F
MTQPTTRRRGPYRFPAMALRCTWCRSNPGELCTNQRGTAARRRDVHSVRIAEWIRVMSIRCPEPICQAPRNQPCTITPDVHQARVLAAHAPTTTTP